MINLKAGQQELFENALQQERDVKLVSESLAMHTLIKKIKSIIKVSSPVLILGESGSGKRMIAKEIFNNSINHNKKLISINLSGMNSDLIDMKLFGSKDNQGYLSSLNEKTLLIKNIDFLSPELQSKLLLFFQNGKILKNKNSYKFRIIATANSSLSHKIEKGEFREDLFRCLSQTLLIMPSLVERQKDILPLVNLFLEENNFKGTLDDSAMNKLQNHNWIGNVVELENICLQIASLYKNQTVSENHIPIFTSKDLDLALFVKYNPKVSLEELVNYYISQSLKHFKSKKKSAESLKISVKTIYNKIDQGSVTY